MTAVADYIDRFYNRTRRHSHLGGVSPEQFEVAHNVRRKGVHESLGSPAAELAHQGPHRLARRGAHEVELRPDVRCPPRLREPDTSDVHEFLGTPWPVVKRSSVAASRRPVTRRMTLRSVSVIGGVFNLALASLALAGCQSRTETSYLMAWAGDSDRQDSDFLAVLDVAPNSNQYGRIIATVPVGERSTTPHHTEHSFTPGHPLFASGYAGNRIFRFDLSTPSQPRLLGAVPALSRLAFSHSFERLPNGNVLATMQAKNADYDAPGGLAEFRDDGSVIRWGSAASGDVDSAALRPYSLAAVPQHDRVVTASARMGLPAWHPRSDGFEHEHTGLHIQLWKLSDLSLLRTVSLAAPEGQDVNLSPYEPRVLEDGRTVLVATARCGLYRVRGLDADSFGADLVYRFDGSGCAVPLRVGRYWIQGVRTTRRVVVLDVSDPGAPILVSQVQFDERQGPHWLALDPAGTRIVVVNNPQVETRIWMLNFDRSNGQVSFDERFRDSGSKRLGVSFDRTDWPHGKSGPAIPHGTVFVQ